MGSSGVHSVLKTKISVKNAFFLNYALVLKKGSKIRIGFEIWPLARLLRP